MRKENYVAVILLTILSTATGLFAHSMYKRLTRFQERNSFYNPFESSTNADEKLKWFGFEEGYQKAVKEGKILLVDAYTDWCGWCKVMDRETYTNAGVIEALNKDFVCVKFNPEIEKEYVFGERKMDARTLLLWLGYGESGGFPTTYFWMNPKSSDVRFNQPGYLPPDQFTLLLGKVVQAKK